MSANTTPEGFDPEQTSSFKVGTLSEQFTEAMEAPATPAAPYEFNAFPIIRSGPAVYYQYSDGRTIVDADLSAPAMGLVTEESRIRELMLARALLRHALHLVDKELNQVGPV